MIPGRTAVILALGAMAGLAIALSGGVLADRGGSAGGLPPGDSRLLAEVLERIKGEYVEKVGDHELMEHAIRGMVTGLDPHSAFLDRGEYEDLRIATEGNYSGIGIEVTLERGTIVVVTPIEGSPAARAGLRPGDVIVAIDGNPVDGARIGDSIARMRGPPGTPVRVTLEREGAGEPIELTVERARISVPSVRTATLAPGIGYLRVSQFSETTGDDVEQALHALAAGSPALAGLVLDLRNNPGGVVESAVQVADAFLDDGLIVTARGRASDANFRLRASPGDLAEGVPVVVLVNAGSASAAEIVAGALRDHRRATLMGRRTFGKGSVQTVLPLGDGQAIKLTTSRYFTPSGASIQGEGIAPDVELPRSEGPLSADPSRDPEVQAALAWLQEGGPRPRVAAGPPPATH